MSVTIVQLAASPFLGGPERQMLGLAASLPASCRTVFLSFAEGGRCQPFLTAARAQGHEAHALVANAPHFWRAATEIAQHLHRVRANVLCCNGYKPDIIGWVAARRAGVPVVSISHGWTAATWKVRLNEALDRLVLRHMDATVCVSEAQAVRVRHCGTAAEKIAVIRNAVDKAAFVDPDPCHRAELESWFHKRPAWIVGAAGRFSPEKGFEQLVQTADLVLRTLPEAGFVLFGDGPERALIQRAILRLGLEDRFILAGFRRDMSRFLPCLDVAVLPSFTEGLPVFVLEAMAAGVPVVATAVGGTPEVVVEGITGHLVARGDPVALAWRLIDLLPDEPRRRSMGSQGRLRVAEQFTFDAQSEAYLDLFGRLTKLRLSRDSSRNLVSSIH
jgi:glycosyltransferase involved in cell wall biosynthesis